MKAQLKLLLKRPEFGITMLLMCCFSIGIFILNCIMNFHSNIDNVLSADQFYIGRSTLPLSPLLALVLSIVIAFPFSDSYFDEKQKNTLPVILTRYKSASNYFISKAFIVFFSAFIVVFIPFMLNIILNSIAFPSESLVDYSRLSSDQTVYYIKDFVQNILFPDFFVKYPQLYNILFCLALSLFLGLGAVLIFCISFFVKRSRILVIASFFIISNIISIVSNVTMSVGINIDFYNYLFSYNIEENKYLLVFGFELFFILLAIFILSKKAIHKMENIIDEK